MAASEVTPKLLDRISNEEYQEKDKWKIDDFALGPANELLISGHNLKTPKTFISMYKEDSGKYCNRPEFNKTFDQTQPGEQLVLFLEDSSIIGLKVESALRVVSIGGLGVLKTLKWKRSPTYVCFYKGKLYVASSSSNFVIVYKLDLDEKRDIFLSDMKSDCVLEMVVVMDKIYVCTKVAGRALVFSMTGSKEMEFKNAIQTDAMAMSICFHERTELVFVSWSNFQIRLYSQETGKCLSAFDITEELHKIHVTTENILVTLSASKCIVAVYDVGEAIKLGESQNTMLSPVKKKHQKKLISHDVENLESHPANFETRSTPWMSASRQSKVEKLQDMKELYMKQLEENENLRRQYDRDVQKLNEKIKELEIMKTELESQQKKLKDSLEEEKEKVTHELRSLVQIRSPNMTLEKKVEEMKEKIQLLERKAAETTNMLSTIQTDLKEVKNNTSELLQENKDQSTVAEAPKTKLKDLAESSNQRQKSKRRSGETSSLESGIGSLTKNAEIKDAIYLHNKSEEQTYRRAASFQSSEIITKDGGRLEIKKTGVSLLVPPGALLEDCKIHIQIITGNLDKGDDVTFASNSAAIVELTPNNFEFQTAVELHLPHCLQLKENFTNESLEVFISHHHPQASPHWERDTEVKFELQEESCKLYLKKFCWVTIRINNEIVEAKRLKIFTVGSKVIETDSETTVYVGYFPDVPGNEDIFIDENITVGQFKPFWFKKEEPTPLIIFLKYLTPREWKNTADESRKEISYQDIASSKNRSYEFVLRCISSVRRSGVPYATFRVYRQHDSTSISFRPKIWNDVSEDEEP